MVRKIHALWRVAADDPARISGRAAGAVARTHHGEGGRREDRAAAGEDVRGVKRLRAREAPDR